MSKGLVNNNPANDPDSKPVKSRSKFKPNYSLYQTVLFGMNTPFFACEAVPDDKFSLRVSSDVDTYTLKAPLMSPVKMHKDYFFASLRSILPNTSELLVTNPLSGDDIVATDVNVVLNIRDLIKAYQQTSTNTYCFVAQLKTAIGGYTSTSGSDYGALILANFLKFYQWTAPVFSAGALCRHLGYNFHDLFHGPISRLGGNAHILSYDEFIDTLIDELAKNIISFKVTYYDKITVGGSMVPRYATVSFRQKDSTLIPQANESSISFRHLLEMAGQNVLISHVQNVVLDPLITPTDFTSIDPDGFNSSIPSNSFANFNIASTVTPWASVVDPASLPEDKYVNLNRLIAYQLANAQFYSNDAVDYIYSTRLWHSNMFTLWKLGCTSAGRTSPVPFFNLNGTSVQYDSCAGFLLHQFFSAHFTQGLDGFCSPTYAVSAGSVDLYRQLSNSYIDIYHLYAGWGYFMNIFGMQRSLRYRDYFVGSKPNPMAVGNVDVSVSGGQFSVVDVTKNIQRQRFLNQVNRVGRKFGEYIDGIFGVKPQHDAHDILWLGSTTDVIGAEETDNTGERQFEKPNSTTSKLRTSSSKFCFEGQFNEQGVIVGILSFDIIRPYVRQMDAENLHIDRFDYFNPFMQTIGDQAVRGMEMSLNQLSNNFAYQLRYSEYKQRCDYAAGGFVSPAYLPGYSFRYDPYEFFVYSGVATDHFHISPDFIRSKSYEFDQFYVSLSHYSPAGYFHFIIRHDMDVDASRPMLAAPSIL